MRLSGHKWVIFVIGFMSKIFFRVFLGHIWPFWGQDEVKIFVLDCTHKENFPFIMFLAV